MTDDAERMDIAESEEKDSIQSTSPAGGDLSGSYESAEPVIAPEKPFIFTKWEGIAALLTYAISFLYTYVWTEFFIDRWAVRWEGRVLAAAFVLGFLLTVEIIHRDTPRPKESWFWLVCTLVTAAAEISGIGEAWDSYAALFLHCFAVYYALVRSGRLMDHTSGPYVFIDGWHAFIGWPFRFFFRKVRTAFRFVFNVKAGETEKETENKLVRYLWALPALFVGGLLLVWATGYLGEADDTFGALLEKLILDWDWDDIGEVILRFVMSLLVGAYIFGSLDGGKQVTREQVDEQKARTDRILSSLAHIPAGVWLFILALFTLVYVVFFAIQGQYLFSALLGKLPEGFTASSYARKGFFELCKVMVVNFALLWFVNFSSEAEVRKHRPLKISLTLLMAESGLLAVTALSKLGLYIHRFGFTPLRIQSSWLVTVLIAGTVLYTVHLWTEKRTFRLWLIFSCGLLAATQFL